MTDPGHMSETTQIILAAMSTIAGIVSAWMAGRSRAHASTAAGAARYVANSLRPPQDVDPPTIRPGMCGILYVSAPNKTGEEYETRRCVLSRGHFGPHGMVYEKESERP